MASDIDLLTKSVFEKRELEDIEKNRLIKTSGPSKKLKARIFINKNENLAGKLGDFYIFSLFIVL